MVIKRLFPLLCWLPLAARAEDLAGLVQDRTAVERVYYHHRLGQKPPFEQVSPPALIQRLVKEDLRKEAVLKNVYGVAVTAALVEAEVQRINTTTRAPDMLAEIKAALGNDPAKFASVFAKPFLVERLLRDKFENDEALHAAQRREAEKVREKLLWQNANAPGRASPRTQTSREEGAHGEAVRARGEARPPDLVKKLLAILRTNTVGQFSEARWLLGARPAEKARTADMEELEIKPRFGPNAQVISSPRREAEWKFYFEDLPGQLQRVLRGQLRQAGDVSAVIETPGGFLVYVCQEKTGETLSVGVLSLPKRNYERWLVEQEGESK